MSQEANSTRTDEVKLPTKPSDDWQLNVILMELADDLTEYDLKKMKYLLTGMNGTGKGVLEVIKDPLDLFQHLRQRRILTSDNITYLQAMLWHTKRKDLYNKFVKFAKTRDNVIHFYAPKDKPENGFEYIKFHIAGRENMDRHKLEELRMHVSHALCVPVEYVIASGIEATNSILVTFMVPEGYANVLSDLSDKDKKYLGSRGVDAIWYQGNLVSCIDIELTGEEECLKRDKEVNTLLEQKSKLDQEVEALQTDVVTLQQRVRQYKKDNEEIAANAKAHIANTTAALIKQHLNIKFTPDALSLKEIAYKNALKYFSHTLKKMETAGYDTDLVQYLLEANRLVVVLRQWTCDQWIQTQQQQMIDRLKRDVAILQYEKDKLRYYLKAGISKPILTEGEEFFVHHIMSSHPPLITRRHTVSVGVEEIPGDVAEKVIIMIEIFKIWEDTLNEKERKIIIETFLPTADDKKEFKESKSYLLQYLWLKHAKEQPGLSFDEWKVKILTTIKRMDLCPIWTKKSEIVFKAFTTLPGDTHQDSQDAESLPAKIPKSKKKQRKDAKKAAATAISSKKTYIGQEINADRLQKIEETVQKNLRLTEKLAQGAFGRPDMPSFPQKIDADCLYDMKNIYKSKIFDNSEIKTGQK